MAAPPKDNEAFEPGMIVLGPGVSEVFTKVPRANLRELIDRHCRWFFDDADYRVFGVLMQNPLGVDSLDAAFEADAPPLRQSKWSVGKWVVWILTVLHPQFERATFVMVDKRAGQAAPPADVWEES